MTVKVHYALSGKKENGFFTCARLRDGDTISIVLCTESCKSSSIHFFFSWHRYIPASGAQKSRVA
jgi:hypothetical protein